MAFEVGAFRFELAPSEDDRLGLVILAAGSFEAKPPELAIRDRRIDHYALGHIAAGHGFVESERGGRHPVGPGSVFWLFPNDPHSIVPDSRWVERWVMFSGDLAATYERAGLLDRRVPVANGRAIPSLPSLFDEVIDTLAAGGPLAGLSASALLPRLLVLAHGARTSLLKPPPGASSPVARALGIIEREAADGIAPIEVARRVGIGYAALRKLFREQTGLSMKEFMLRSKLRRAKELLAQSQESIESIASAVGITDPFYFSRLFRRYEGLSPRAYRRRSRMYAHPADP